jgi:hypothetical protein
MRAAVEIDYNGTKYRSNYSGDKDEIKTMHRMAENASKGVFTHLEFSGNGTKYFFPAKVLELSVIKVVTKSF